MTASARDKFLRAGGKLYPDLGYHKLSVRVLAAEAGLSAGMFHHSFASKDEFVAQLLKHAIQEEQNRIDALDFSEYPFEKLVQVLRILAWHLRANMTLFHRILTDSADGVACVSEFIRQTMVARMAMMEEVLAECAKLDDSVPASLMQRVAYLSSSVMVPMVVSSRFKQMGLLSAEMEAGVPDIFTDEAIDQRIHMSIAAMFPNYRQFLPFKQQETS